MFQRVLDETHRRGGLRRDVLQQQRLADAGCAQQAQTHTAFDQATEPLFERLGTRLDVARLPRFGFAEPGACGGVGHGGGDTTEGIHQPALFRLLAAPHPPARDRVDLLYAAPARLRDLAGEVAIALVDHRLHDRADARIQRTGEVECAGIFRGADTIGMHAELVQRAVGGREQAEDADRAGDGRRIGIDAIGIHADPVTAGGGDIAHRNDHRFAGLLQRRDFTTDLLRCEHFAARRVHPQHHRLHIVVVARAAQQGRGRFATHLARRQLAAGDFALGHHHRHLRAQVGRRQRAVEMLHVGLQCDLAEPALGGLVGLAALGQQVLDLLAGLQAIDQLLLQCHPCKVAIRTGDLFAHRVDVRRQCSRIQPARLADVGQHALPDIVHPVQVGFLRFRRGRIEDVGLGRRLVLADLEQVHVHAELVLQALAEVLAIRGQTFQHHPALRHRVEIDLVRLHGEQVLALAVVLAIGDHLLAGGLHFRDGGGHVAQRGKPARLQFVQMQHHAFDALVGARRIQCAQHVAQADLAAIVAIGGTGEGAADRIAAVLLDQAALGFDHQGRALRQRRQLAAAQHRRQQHEHDQQEQQVERQPATEIDRIPQADEQAGDGAAAARWVHCGLREEQALCDVDMLARWREAFMRHRSR